MKISVEGRHIDCGGQNVGGSWLRASQGRLQLKIRSGTFGQEWGMESLRGCRASPSNP
jgi:hypothetical protein